MPVAFTLNGKAVTLDSDPDMPLLWAIREVVGLHGTKYGCGIAQCGAGTVHIEGQATRSCDGGDVLTLHGGERRHQQSFIPDRADADS